MAVRQAVQELDTIKKSEMTGEVLDPIIVVQDWEGRVYVNGGDKKPIRMRVRLHTVDRTLAVTLPTSVFYREKPEDPMFRLRIRAQAGVMLPDVLRSSGTTAFDAGIGFDFFHLGPMNVDVHTGVASAGAGIGLDMTKNFGVRAGWSYTYRDPRSVALVAAYMSFN